MGVEVPAWVAANLEAERRTREVTELAAIWTKVLQEELDPRLSIVFIGEGTPEEEIEQVPEGHVVANRWHVRRRNDPPIADSYMPITTPDGGYREPDSGILFELGRRDMWRGGSVDAFLQTRREDEQRRVRARELRREQLKDEMAADIRAAYRVPGDAGMTRRRRGAGRKRK
jgi:hypothetical protein